MLDRPALAGADLRQRAEPERPAHHGGVLDEQLLLHGQCVEAGGDDRLHRLGHRQLRSGQLGTRARRSQQAAVEQHAHVLLREQRVPARAGEQRRPKLRREVGCLEQVGHQPRRLVVGQRRQLEDRGATPAHAPAGPPLDQLGAAGDEHQQAAREAAAEVIRDELEQAVVRPVHVLEDEDERAPGGDLLEEPAPGRERLDAVVAA